MQANNCKLKIKKCLWNRTKLKYNRKNKKFKKVKEFEIPNFIKR